LKRLESDGLVVRTGRRFSSYALANFVTVGNFWFTFQNVLRSLRR